MPIDCSKPRAYKPRRPRTTALWKVLNGWFSTFLGVYEERYQKKLGALRDVVIKRVGQYLACGLLERGFSRFKCEGCNQELFVSFSCRTRGLCPSCQGKRKIEFAEFLNEKILERVAHRHIVLGLPLRLRPFFMHNRKLLKKLARCAWMTIREILRSATGIANGSPGAVIAIHTCGSLMDFHAHLHIIVTWGVYSKDTFFSANAAPSPKTLEELFRHKVLKMMLDEGLIDEKIVENLLSWHNPGFCGFISPLISPALQPSEAENAQEKNEGPFPEGLLAYLARGAVSLDRMNLVKDGSVIYKADSFHPRHKSNFRIFADPLDFIATLIPHIPDNNEKTILYYGRYSQKSRGLRRKKALAGVTTVQAPKTPAPASRAWREMIRRVYETDPLTCPSCGSRLKFIAVVDSEDGIRKILDHLGLFDDGMEDTSRAPPPLSTTLTVEPFFDHLPVSDEDLPGI